MLPIPRLPSLLLLFTSYLLESYTHWSVVLYLCTGLSQYTIKDSLYRSLRLTNMFASNDPVMASWETTPTPIFVESFQNG